jgi:hypothetical protein
MTTPAAYPGVVVMPASIEPLSYSALDKAIAEAIDAGTLREFNRQFGLGS